MEKLTAFFDSSKTKVGGANALLNFEVGLVGPFGIL